MPGWAASVINFGGELPIHDESLIPDNQASAAWNADLDSGRLQGLPELELVHDMTASATTVYKAYRFPGPTSGDPDAWLPLPSPHSSVVKSPLANDTLHRVFWTNPDTGDPATTGGLWNTYDRIIAGDPPYRMGFLPVEPYWVPVVNASGGSLPFISVYPPPNINVVLPGIGYGAGDILEVIGGTVQAGQSITKVVVKKTKVVGIFIATPGSGGTDGPVLVYGTTGTGNVFMCHGVIAGGMLMSLGGFDFEGLYDTNPVDLAHEPVIGGGLVGATVALNIGVAYVYGWVDGGYTDPPPNPAETGNISSGGAGCTLQLAQIASGHPPLVSRSYLFTYVDIYDQESSPSVPSAVVDGASDGVWRVFGISNVPPTSFVAGAIYPQVNRVRVYRTVVGATSGGQFYMIGEMYIPPGIDPSIGWVDTSADIDIVGNNTLESTSWAPPPPNLDGLTSLPAGMLVGFTGNTIHFCEPNRPNVWPASYDLSVNFEVVNLGVWSNTLVVLTKGFPSTGSGSTPANFHLQQLQIGEPCIARGSVVSDILGVYYSSPNGLVMINYYGITNQTQLLISRKQWLVDFHGAALLAARHRSQYLAINTIGSGFLIDFAEARRGVVHLNTFALVVSIWNDVVSGDAYVMAANKVYRWDSPTSGPLLYRWRSKRWALPEPTNVGACQVSLSDAVLGPIPGGGSMLDNGDPLMALPPGVIAMFKLYANDSLVVEKSLAKPLEIFRLPSGFKVFEWQFEIVSWVPIFSVELAPTMKELRKI